MVAPGFVIPFIAEKHSAGGDMDVYVVDFEGRGIMALNTDSALEAEEYLSALLSNPEAEVFRNDLMGFRIAGRHIWDGTEQLHVRPALSPERQLWAAQHARVCADKDVPDGYDANTGQGFLCCYIADPS
jgi:hypothetical protein